MEDEIGNDVLDAEQARVKKEGSYWQRLGVSYSSFTLFGAVSDGAMVCLYRSLPFRGLQVTSALWFKVVARAPLFFRSRDAPWPCVTGWAMENLPFP